MVIKKSVVSCIFKNIFELGDPQKVGDLQSPLVAQWIKDPALSLVWLRLLLWCGVGSIPDSGTAAFRGHGQKKKKKKKKRGGLCM